MKEKDQRVAAAKQFINDCNPERLSRNLRKILLDYIVQNKNHLPTDFDICLYDLSMLFDFLDALRERK